MKKTISYIETINKCFDLFIQTIDGEVEKSLTTKFTKDDVDYIKQLISAKNMNIDEIRHHTNVLYMIYLARGNNTPFSNVKEAFNHLMQVISSYSCVNKSNIQKIKVLEMEVADIKKLVKVENNNEKTTSKAWW